MMLPPPNQPTVDLNILAEEARTGRFMFGAGVNSDLGVTGQIVIDERNFDPFRIPTSWDDVLNGAWRGAGQGFRLEAMPGTQVHRSC
jgi:outer membrane protein insertion porin family